MPSHDIKEIGRRFLLSIGLSMLILLAEVIGGLWTGSLALLSDAAHVFMDVFALVLSYLALRLSALPADDRHTYGYHRLEVLAALINGVTLGAIAIEIFTESWRRWQNPVAVKSLEMLVIAVIGLLVNLVVAYLLGGHGHTHTHTHSHGDVSRQDLNVRSAYLHVVGDAVSSLGVILAAALIWFTGWNWIDPLISVLIGALIVLSSWRVLRQSFHILVEGVPEHLSLQDIEGKMIGVAGVEDVHDLHIWSICSGHIALSAHIVSGEQDAVENARILAELKEELLKFDIGHATIQFEKENCGQGRTSLRRQQKPV